ncbi:hypothetical protein LshimejAT787_0606290 [Lyophyllum shimeji]|uniref:Uncharacterized protein n=1 Tax=Lyophyllum shimeji TaxID=47721 RepID=A0A9P3PQD1_LYOSH|nr:hypothetical protein LshimejAT787_0606290 [Lyophyllum shimeji]
MACAALPPQPDRRVDEPVIPLTAYAMRGPSGRRDNATRNLGYGMKPLEVRLTESTNSGMFDTVLPQRICRLSMHRSLYFSLQWCLLRPTDSENTSNNGLWVRGA